MVFGPNLESGLWSIKVKDMVTLCSSSDPWMPHPGLKSPMAYREACPVTMGMAAVRPVKQRKRGSAKERAKAKEGQRSSPDCAAGPIHLFHHPTIRCSAGLGSRCPLPRPIPSQGRVLLSPSHAINSDLHFLRSKSAITQCPNAS